MNFITFGKILIVVAVNMIILFAYSLAFNIGIPLVIYTGIFQAKAFTQIMSLLTLGTICLVNAWFWKKGIFTKLFKRILKERNNERSQTS